jgi:hypothetical protein
LDTSLSQPSSQMTCVCLTKTLSMKENYETSNQLSITTQT